MVSYLLKNTVSENGSVARGVCALNEDSTLHSVTECTRIETYEGGIHYTEDGGGSWTDLPGETPVSMNLWGFGESFVKEADRRFAAGWTRTWKRTRSSASISCRWWSVSSSAKRSRRQGAAQHR